MYHFEKFNNANKKAKQFESVQDGVALNAVVEIDTCGLHLIWLDWRIFVTFDFLFQRAKKP